MWEVKLSLELSDGSTRIVMAKADKLMMLYAALEMLPVRYLILSGERKPVFKKGGSLCHI